MEKSQIPTSWIEMLEAQNSSGKSAAAWCRENEIATSTFYYRRKKVEEAEKEETTEKEAVQEIVKIEIKEPDKYEKAFSGVRNSSKKIRMIKGDILIEFPVSETAEILSAVMRGCGEIC